MWLKFPKASFSLSVLFGNIISYVLNIAAELHYGFSWYLNLSKWSFVSLPCHLEMSKAVVALWRGSQWLDLQQLWIFIYLKEKPDYRTVLRTKIWITLKHCTLYVLCNVLNLLIAACTHSTFSGVLLVAGLIVNISIIFT